MFAGEGPGADNSLLIVISRKDVVQMLWTCGFQIRAASARWAERRVGEALPQRRKRHHSRRLDDQGFLESPIQIHIITWAHRERYRRN